MQEFGIKSKLFDIKRSGLKNTKTVYWNLSPAELIEEALKNKEGVLSDTGAIMCDTGIFTGRSPKDKFIVKDAKTADTVWWGDINFPIEGKYFDQLHQKMLVFLEDKDIYVRDAYAGAHPDYQLRLRVVNTQAWQNMFCYNMFLRPDKTELENFEPNFTILCIPEFEADPAIDGVRQANFTMIDFTKRIILIGGSGYAGEMKKGIFSVLNYTLPKEEGVLSMHCSANVGDDNDTAIFFGLSGTGKTTLSADASRHLIGDDEHGWSEDTIFNFEGGCYAKVIDLSKEKEPEIWNAIRFGSILENTRFIPGTHTPDYANTSVTQNTRTAYPIHFIDNALEKSMAGAPKNIFFLTCDAYGVLPPISKLTTGQTMYHFISGYTAKIAGTEVGITDPEATFSACFGAAFLPLHPTEYAELLGKKIKSQEVNVWLINTGWTGGGFGVGSRMKLSYTRAMIHAALENKLNEVVYEKHSVFGVNVPQSCPNVSSEILNPRQTWQDKEAYDAKANLLAQKFVKNFEKYAGYANEEILGGSPVVALKAS
jgi:phosphoenolpyruvate carboxykinase (ATP)